MSISTYFFLSNSRHFDGLKLVFDILLVHSTHVDSSASESVYSPTSDFDSKFNALFQKVVD